MGAGGPAAGAISLAENVVLGLVSEGPTHGFAVGRQLDPGAPLGRAYRVPRPVVYRALDRLLAAGLVREVGVRPGEGGPQRTIVEVTAAGRRAVTEWLARPVPHVRDLRVEFLVKLALLERAGWDRRPLVDAQQQVVAELLAALGAQKDQAEGFDAVIAAWRHETARAAARFLDGLEGLSGSEARAAGSGAGGQL